MRGAGHSSSGGVQGEQPTRDLIHPTSDHSEAFGWRSLGSIFDLMHVPSLCSLSFTQLSERRKEWVERSIRHVSVFVVSDIMPITLLLVDVVIRRRFDSAKLKNAPML